MTDPIQALQDYGHEVEVIVSPITPEEIHGRVTHLVPEPGLKRAPAWFAGVAVAALLLVVLGGVSLLTRGPAISIPPAAPSPQTVSVDVLGVSGYDGNDLAGVLYEGDGLTDLDQDAIGGFWSVIATDSYTTTEVLREPGTIEEGRFPYVSSEALELKPGTYTLVLWVDTSLGGSDRWVPINTDGMGLFGCHFVFEVSNDPETNITISPTFHPNGWNTHCTTGAVTPGTDANAAVNPNPEGTFDPWATETVVSLAGGTQIMLSLDTVEGLGGLVVDGWVLGFPVANEPVILGEAQLSNLQHNDPFSASAVLALGDMGSPNGKKAAEFPPGEYRFVIEAYVPNGDMRYGCERQIVTQADRSTDALVFTTIPEYTGDGLHWTPYDELKYPDCPMWP